MGYGGRIAIAYATLLHEIWSGKQQIIEPRAFKNIIDQVASRFTEEDNQNGEEFLSFLLNGLHEDLNKILNKPFTESIESNGRSDDIVALESWNTYLMRNQSIFVDTMHGQNNRHVCPDCGKVTIKFDPYMLLSVPLPTDRYRIIEYTWIDTGTSIPPTCYGQKMLKVADIDMLKEAVAKSFNQKSMILTDGYIREIQQIMNKNDIIPPELNHIIYSFYQKVHKAELFVCDIWKSKIYRQFTRHDSMADISRRSDDIFIYHSPKPNMKEWKIKKSAEPDTNNKEKETETSDDNEDYKKNKNQNFKHLW